MGGWVDELKVLQVLQARWIPQKRKNTKTCKEFSDSAEKVSAAPQGEARRIP